MPVVLENVEAEIESEPSTAPASAPDAKATMQEPDPDAVRAIVARLAMREARVRAD